MDIVRTYMYLSNKSMVGCTFDPSRKKENFQESVFKILHTVSSYAAQLFSELAGIKNRNFDILVVLTDSLLHQSQFMWLIQFLLKCYLSVHETIAISLCIIFKIRVHNLRKINFFFYNNIFKTFDQRF